MMFVFMQLSQPLHVQRLNQSQSIPPPFDSALTLPFSTIQPQTNNTPSDEGLKFVLK